jgi:hypothetical protein
MTGVNVSALIILVFALAFACFEAFKGSTGVKPTNWGWAALAMLIVSQIFFRGADVFFK